MAGLWETRSFCGSTAVVVSTQKKPHENQRRQQRKKPPERRRVGRGLRQQAVPEFQGSPAPQDLAGAHSCARGVGAGLSRPQTQRSLSAAGSFLHFIYEMPYCLFQYKQIAYTPRSSHEIVAAKGIKAVCLQNALLFLLFPFVLLVIVILPQAGLPRGTQRHEHRASTRQLLRFTSLKGYSLGRLAWCLPSSPCRAEETSPRRVSGT